MLDMRADNGLPYVGLLDMIEHELEMRFFMMALRDKTLVFYEVFMGF